MATGTPRVDTVDTTSFERAVSAATAPTGNTRADMLLAQAAMDAMNAQNTKVDAVAVATLKSTGDTPHLGEPKPVPAATVVEPKKEAAKIASADKGLLVEGSTKLVTGARKAVKIAAVTAVVGGGVLVAASALTPAVCATNALAGGVVCEAVLPSAVGLNTALTAAGAGIAATATHVYDIGVREAYKNYQEHGSIYAPILPQVEEETFHFCSQKVAATGLALAAATAALLPEPAHRALTSALEAAKDPVGTLEAAKTNVRNFFAGE